MKSFLTFIVITFITYLVLSLIGCTLIVPSASFTDVSSSAVMLLVMIGIGWIPALVYNIEQGKSQKA